METLSASVSTLKVPPLPSSSALTNREFYRFKPSSTPPLPFVPKTKSFSNKPSPSLPFSPSTLKSISSSSPVSNPNPATGYAAALADVAHKSNSLHSVHSDVQRLLKLLQSHSPALEHGNFHRHFVALLNMLLKKNRVGIVKEVLLEFLRIYDHLSGTQMVLVSSNTKMPQDELFRIAKTVHQFSGAPRVKVRNLVQ